jgi:ElaB/YqjD/DUF883 family membrane-anchored ribosome-binding protein
MDQDVDSSGATVSTTSDDTSSKADAAKEQAGQLAGSAQGKASEVAGTAKDQAGQVANEAKAHAQELAGQTADQLNTQAGEQAQRLSSTLGELSDQLGSMADGGEPGTTAHAVVSDLADRSGRLSSYLADREPREILRDVQDFGRRRPAAFIAGAAVAGLLVGRFGKVAKNAPDPAPSTGGPSTGTSYEPSSPALDSEPLAIADDEPTSPGGAPVGATAFPPGGQA